jgi:hypothetical protein
MDCGTKIMAQAGERELEGARSAARLWLGFKDVDVHAAFRKHNRSRQAVGSSADDASSANHSLAQWRSGISLQRVKS